MKLIILITLISVSLWQRVDYSKFSHATKKHQAECKTCHLVPSDDWRRLSKFPDVVEYPDHVACVSCHRAQFFKGARPPICSVCHSKTSPRDEARYAFRNPASRLQFTIEFPHDKHQDVIAGLFNVRRPGVALAHALAPQQQNYNNCTICHASQTTTFKAAPSDHASCFNCHWQSQEPVAANCNGCHKLATAPYDAATTPARISSKFIHEGGGEKANHVLECTACHINITKSKTLRGLKPDVPITACTECHNKEGLRQDVSKELAAIDKNRAFTCVYCHAPNVGSLDPPASHYLIAERPPLKRKDIK
ncbi:MAG TPA: cytochrome c3 family protein [Pyrinomonadaceae bacterium]|nr:cytochrome c3 family protein [Pyrinomonadaceae bacterium]